MAAVLHRTTKQYLASANTPDYPLADWIHNPDLSAVAGFDSRYWTISGDTVTLMDAAARSAVDSAQVEQARDGDVSVFDAPEAVLRQFVAILVDELNAHATATAGIRQAILDGSNLSAIKTAAQAVSVPPQRTLAQLRSAIRSRMGT